MKKFLLIPAQVILLFSYGETSLSRAVMSRGQQQLPINYIEFISRARKALTTVGFTNAGTGFAQGFKDASGSYILCNDAPGGGMIVNIVVATIGNDNRVPGLLRQCLEAQMEKPGTPTACTARGGGSLGESCGLSGDGLHGDHTSSYDVTAQPGCKQGRDGRESTGRSRGFTSGDPAHKEQT